MRSVYLPIPRGVVPDSLQVFDMADPNLIVGKRDVTTVPTQALYLMNNPFVLKQAGQLARRVLDQQGLDQDGRIAWAYRLAIGRPPSSSERANVSQFLAEFRKSLAEADKKGNPQVAAWTYFCQTLFGVRRISIRVLNDELRHGACVFGGVSCGEREGNNGYSASVRRFRRKGHDHDFRQLPGIPLPPPIAQDGRLRFRLPGPGRSLRRSVDRRRGQWAGSATAAFQAASQARDLPVHAGRSFARRHVRLQAAVAGRRRQDDRRQGQGTEIAQVALQIHQAWPERAVVSGDLSQPGRTRRRLVPAQQHVHRRRRPPAGDHPDAHRQFPLSPALDGGLDRLRPGNREHGTARLHHHQSGRRCPELRQLLSAGLLSGHQDRRNRRGRQSQEPGGRYRESPAHR